MKITLATIKSFIRKNPTLYIKKSSNFDGMYDCVMPNQNAQFELAQTPAENQNYKNCLGIQGAWFVFESSDYFSVYDDGIYKGYHVYNCCGSFTIATKQ